MLKHSQNFSKIHLFQFIIWMENNFEISEYWSMFLELNILRKQETYFLLIFHFMSTTHGTFLRNTVQWADLCSSQKTTRTPPGGKSLKLARKTLRIAVNSCNYIFTWTEFFTATTHLLRCHRAKSRYIHLFLHTYQCICRYSTSWVAGVCSL